MNRWPNAAVRAAHLALHGYVDVERPITMMSLRRATRGMRECRIAITAEEIFMVYELPGFIPVAQYGSAVPGPDELGAVETARIDLVPL